MYSKELGMPTTLFILQIAISDKWVVQSFILMPFYFSLDK